MTASDRSSSHPDANLECVVLERSSFSADEIDAIVSSLGDERCRFVDSPEEIEADSANRCVVLYRWGHDPEFVRGLAERLRDGDPPKAAVCVVDDGAWREATAALREGATETIFAEQLGSTNLDATLMKAAGRVRAEDRDRRVQQTLEERSSELLGVNALANGVSSSLDRDLIVRRGLWVFAGVCQQDAAALLELRPHPTLGETRDDEEPSDQYLERIASFSTGELDIVEERVELEASWQNIIRENHIAMLEGEPDDDVFPGLDPFWDEYPEGCLTLVPVRASQTAIGALVLGETSGEEDIAPGRDGLQAMAMQFGSALENARLFEEVKATYESLQETQDQLVHAEKFAAVGVLAAEVAHEINNPASFVISNLSVMDEYAESITGFLDELEEALVETTPELEEHFDDLKREYEIEYLRDDMDALLSRSLSGMQRIHQIVQDLRYLSRGKSEEPGWVEIESLLDATVNLVRHEAKFRAELRRDFDDVPQVMSDSSRLSQVFLNLLVNAVHAIESGDVEENYIRVGTEQCGDAVVVTVEDSGSGIAPQNRDRIFEPFFTTKETGEGTGLGLSISRDIVKSLGGEIDFDSEPGEGTTFRVTIPIRAEKYHRDRDLRDSGYYDTPPGLEEISDDIF